MRLIGLAGWSGAGKTTLLAKLIPVLKHRGLAVSTVKHAHHAFDVDQPGKDSQTHRSAGASEVLIASRRRWALVHENGPGEGEPLLQDLLQRLSPVDLVVVEGFKAHAHPKIEIHRVANAKPYLFPQVPNVRLIASDGAVADAPVPVLDLDDVNAIADAILAEAIPVAEALAILEAAPPPERLRRT